MQNLSVERRFLTIALMYGIITAGKEFMRSWIFDFSIATISQRNELDHTFDHLRSWTMWKQYLREHRKAPISDSKASKSLVNQGKNRFRFVRDVEVASSNLVISTIKTKERQRLSFVFMMRYSSSSWLRSNCKFAYPVRRSPSSLGRRRTWVSRSVAPLPCHLDQRGNASLLFL